jgi:outer membrane protein assembly factor BamA
VTFIRRYLLKTIFFRANHLFFISIKQIVKRITEFYKALFFNSNTLNINKLYPYLFFIFSGFFLASCSGTRFIPENKFLLHKNKIQINAEKTSFSKYDLSILISQKPNSSFLGTRFRLWTYYVTENKKDKKLWNWVHNTIGKTPVYLDENLSNSSAQQMMQYLHNVGYFNNQVNHTLSITKKRTARVFYNVNPFIPYLINEINYKIPDTNLAAIVEEIKPESLIKKDDIYNAYTFDDERDRITAHLKNNGFYYFTKDYILFEADSNTLNKKININLIIENRRSISTETNSELIEEPHQRYHIRRVGIFPTHNPFSLNLAPFDTSYIDIKTDANKQKSRLYFYANDDLRIKPSIFSQVIQIYENDLFNLSKLRQTYKGLTNLKIYRASNITFDTTGSKINTSDVFQNWIDCNIYLQRNKANAYSFEVEGTNSSGDLGIRGSLVYTNRNLFKGAEVLRVRLNGGFEAQKISVVNIELGESKSAIFNTTETGIDANINFPRFLSPIPLRKFIKEYQPKTNINLGFSSQILAYYQRFILRTAFGYDWKSSNTVNQIFTPINFNSVKVDPSPEFKAFLDKVANQRFKDQYSNHLILSLRYSFIFNNQNINKLNNFFYNRFNIESAGNLLSMFDKTSLFTYNDDYAELFGIRYAQFLRIDNDFRYYRLLSLENRLVFRTFIGLAIPYGNSSETPFERSFYAGGANGMRGWQFRQLGPGTYSDTLNIERIGDIHLEFNAEYRFPIYDYLKGALFIDVGNIWSISEKEHLPGAEFRLDKFYKDLAVDAGIGFRFDLSFFVFRLDAATPLRDPSKDGDEKWQLDKIQLKKFVWNFGIGYPF